MSFLMGCGTCCKLLSIWAIIQLTIMGILFHFQVPILIDDVKPSQHSGYKDFLAKTKENYSKVAVNCWIAAVGYFFTLLLSFWCISTAKKKAKLQALKMADDELICTQEDPEQSEPKKKKERKKKQKKTKTVSP